MSFIKCVSVLCFSNSVSRKKDMFIATIVGNESNLIGRWVVLLVAKPFGCWRLSILVCRRRWIVCSIRGLLWAIHSALHCLWGVKSEKKLELGLAWMVMTTDTRSAQLRCIERAFLFCVVLRALAICHLQHSYLYWNMLVLDCEIEEGSTIWQIPLVIIHWNEDNIEFYIYIQCPKAWRYWGKTEVGNFIVRILIFYTYCESQRKPSP